MLTIKNKAPAKQTNKQKTKKNGLTPRETVCHCYAYELAIIRYAKHQRSIQIDSLLKNMANAITSKRKNPFFIDAKIPRLPPSLSLSRETDSVTR